MWKSPVLLALIVGGCLLFILLVRGLDIGPLQTDVIIFRAWFREVGLGGFSERYFAVNQRHFLVGTLYTLIYGLFGEWDLPYHVIFHASRIFEGVFLAGIVYQLTRRFLLSICAGLALMLTVIRVPELYQEINWFIEPTLGLLLASSYFYLRSLRAPSHGVLWYILSVIAYIVSILIYEAGLPWIQVNLFLGWFVRSDQTWRSRLWHTVRDALPSLAVAVATGIAVLFVYKPWDTLTPDTSAGFIARFVQELGTVLTFPLVFLDTVRLTGHDGYYGLIIVFALLAGASIAILSSYLPSVSGESRLSKKEFLALSALAVMMLITTVLIGTTSQHISPTYLDRITFGRAAGISLLYVTLIFGAWGLIRVRWSQTAAAVVTGLVFIGPGFAWLWIYQDYAQATRAEIDRMTAAVLDIREVMYSPAHLVIVTDPDWVGARFVDAADVVVHEVQQNLWELGGDATIDILHTAAHPEEYATYPYTCKTVSGEYSAGICLDLDEVYGSRWAVGAPYPNEDIVVVQYDSNQGKMTILPEIRVNELQNYNLTTAGPVALSTNPRRLAIPLE